MATYPAAEAAAASSDFPHAALVFGGLLVLGALVSGVARRSFLALTPVFVLAGFALGNGGLDVLDFDPRGGFVAQLASVALIVILFRDGLEVEGELLQRAWHLPARKLVIAMPVTAGIVALGARLLTDLGWTECFLIGALLSPTDPVLSSGVVTNPRVPRIIRHSLNLESGLNDGLALPPVLALVAVLSSDGGFVWWRFILQDVGLGLAFGVLIGLVASVVLPRGTALAGGIPPHQRSLYAVGVAFLTYGATVLPPSGNGYVAVFVCAITLGIRRPDVRRYFERGSAEIVEVVKLGIFVVFGSLLTLGGLFEDGVAAVALVAIVLLVARPGGRLPRAGRDGHATGPPGLHVLVRPEGRGDDGLLADRPRLERGGGGHAHLPPLRARGALLDRRARADRHAGRRLDRAPHAARGRAGAGADARLRLRRRGARPAPGRSGRPRPPACGARCGKTKCSWLGGRRPSGLSGRKVAQGSSSASAQSVLQRK